MKRGRERKSREQHASPPAIIISACWSLNGAALGLAYFSPGSLGGAILGLVFAFGTACLYRLDPIPKWRNIFLMGFCAHAACCYWLPGSIELYTGLPLAAAWAAAALLYVPYSLQFVFFEAVRRVLSKEKGLGLSLALPAAWVSAEVLFPKAMPWSLGQTQLWFLTLAQSADLVGFPLVSFLVYWWAALLVDGYSAWYRHDFRGVLRRAVALASVPLVLIYGTYRIVRIDAQLASAPALKVALVQGNLDAFHDYFDGRMEDRIAKVKSLTGELLRRKRPDLVIWPESAVGHDYFTDEQGRIIDAGRDPFAGLSVPLIFGGQARVRQVYSAKPQYYNSVFLRAPEGTLAGMYRKQVLFPFSERVPFADYFPHLERLRGKDHVLLAAGKPDPLGVVVRRIHRDRPLRIAAAVCFEDMWPEVFLGQMKPENADFLLVLTNDGWFGKTAAARQHYLVSAWRAIELRRTLVRATNSGVTAVVDAAGREVSALAQHIEGTLYEENVKILDGRSLYVRLGQRPVWWGALAILGWAAVLWLKSVRIR